MYEITNKTKKQNKKHHAILLPNELSQNYQESTSGKLVCSGKNTYSIQTSSRKQ